MAQKRETLNITTEQWDQIKTKYLSGLSMVALAQEFGTTFYHINTYLREMNVVVRSRSLRLHFSKEMESEICRLYINGQSTNDIAKKFNLDKSTIKTRLEKSGISVRRSRIKLWYDVEDIIELYLLGYSLEILARRYESSHSAITNILKKNNIPRREARPRINANKYQSDIERGLVKSLRSRIGIALKKLNKSVATKTLVGCSLEELKQHLESQFYCNPKTGEPMTWTNRGEYGWHLDHIKPCSSFDLATQSNKSYVSTTLIYNHYGGGRIWRNQINRSSGSTTGT